MSHITPDRLAGLAAELTSIRRDIHRHPETAFEETRTAQIVADKLTAWGIEIHRGLATTGVVGTLKGKRPGQKTIGLRADMDALPILEETGAAYASQNHGVMHACGHDGHTTMLLGAAKYLAGLRPAHPEPQRAVDAGVLAWLADPDGVRALLWHHSDL